MLSKLRDVNAIGDDSMTSDYQTERSIEFSEQVPNLGALAKTPRMNREVSPQKLIREELGDSALDLSLMKDDVSEMTIGTEDMADKMLPNLTTSPLKDSRV